MQIVFYFGLNAAVTALLGGKLLLLRAGLYNIMGNPPEEEILDFYSVHWHRHCMPYAGVSFKF